MFQGYGLGKVRQAQPTAAPHLADVYAFQIRRFRAEPLAEDGHPPPSVPGPARRRRGVGLPLVLEPRDLHGGSVITFIRHVPRDPLHSRQHRQRGLSLLLLLCLPALSPPLLRPLLVLLLLRVTVGMATVLTIFAIPRSAANAPTAACGPAAGNASNLAPRAPSPTARCSPAARTGA